MKGNEAENLLRDMQEYRELTDRVKAIFGDQMTLKVMVDVMERIIREPGRKDPVNARILTYDEAAMWDEYMKIGTPEECREAMEKQKPEKPSEVCGLFGGIAYNCPYCGGDVRYLSNYCSSCGQKLDWREENE